MTIGLLHQNISCTLYESAPAFAEIGAGVSFGRLGSSSLKVFEECRKSPHSLLDVIY